jgi:hypothetical protein
MKPTLLHPLPDLHNRLASLSGSAPPVCVLTGRIFRGDRGAEKLGSFARVSDP